MHTVHVHMCRYMQQPDSMYTGVYRVQYLCVILPPPHQIVTVSEDDENTDAFKAAQVNIGMFGVLTEVTVKVDHAFNLEEFRTHTTLDDCLEHFKDLVEDSGFQYVKFWVEFYNNLCVVYRTRRTTLSVKDPPSDLLAFLTVSNCSTVRCA